MTLRSVAIVILLLHIGSFGVPARAAENKAANIQLTILANEGILIRSADSGILIDAFVEVDQTDGNSVAGAIVQDMLAGRPPFSSIQLAIVSHPHREHFDATTAGTFLKNNRETILHNLKARNIDIVVVPLWLFKEESVRAIIDQHVAPKRVVVAQIPLGALATVSELSKTFPDVVFLSSPMASAEF